MKNSNENNNFKILPKKNLKLILASESPRRKHILEEAGFKFQILPVKVSEIPQKNLNIDEQVIDIARRKAEAWLEQHNSLISQDLLVLTADTLVILDGEALGKPVDKNQARQFLDRLSGRVHEVKTAMTFIFLPQKEFKYHIETTRVEFKNLSIEEIENYISTDEPYDKAGAYGLQGEGRKFIHQIHGEYNNVIGLPLEAFKKIISDCEIEFF